MTTTAPPDENTATKRQSFKPQTVLLLDATVEEEACAYAQVFVALTTTTTTTDAATTKSTTVSGVRLVCRDGGSLPMALLPDCVGLAVRAVQEGRVPNAYSYRAHDTATPFLTPIYTVAL